MIAVIVDTDHVPQLGLATEQVQREAAARDYANLRLQQPYERALYDQDLALQTRRWHISEYEAVIGDLRPEDLRARFFMPLCPVQGANKARDAPEDDPYADEPSHFLVYLCITAACVCA